MSEIASDREGEGSDSEAVARDSSVKDSKANFSGQQVGRHIQTRNLHSWTIAPTSF